MSKTIAIFGATGQQGGSVLRHVIQDPILSKEFTSVRALTRDVDSAAAKALLASLGSQSSKVNIVRGDVDDCASLSLALSGGVDTVFLVTAPSMGPNAVEDEFQRGKAVVDVAIEQGVRYFIFSTLPAVSDISGGKYTAVTPFDAKAKIEAYIRGLSSGSTGKGNKIRSAFVSIGSYMGNFHTQPFMNPKPLGDGTFELVRPTSGKAKMPLIEADADVGKFVGAILARPDEFEGKTVCVSEREYDFEEIAELLSETTGKTVKFRQISAEEFRNSIPWFADTFTDAALFVDEFGGYYGPDTKKMVEEAPGSVGIEKGNLVTFEEFLKKNPVELPEA